MGLRANRDFLGRAVRFMAESGVRQFLDLGTGIPSGDNTHAVALSVARLFTGLELVEPGVTTVGRWHDEGADLGGPDTFYAGVARKP